MLVLVTFYEHLYCTDSAKYIVVVSLPSKKCTYNKSLWIKMSAKCPKCMYIIEIQAPNVLQFVHDHFQSLVIVIIEMLTFLVEIILAHYLTV